MRDRLHFLSRVAAALACAMLATSAAGAEAAAASGQAAVAQLGPGFTSQTLALSGTALHYVRGGAGPAILLLHGFPEDWLEYRKVMPELAKRFTVIAVDLPGVGGSAPSASGYTNAAMADEIHELLAGLRLERVYVVGHDVGGIVAYAFIRRHPDDIRGAMILDAPLPGIGPWNAILREPLVWHVGFHQAPDELAEKLVMGRQAVYFRNFLRGPAFTDDDVAHYAAAYAKESQLHAMFEMYRAFPGDAALDAAQRGRVDVPLVVGAGELSPFHKYVPAIAAALRANGCESVRTATIAGSSHYVMEEAPAQVLALIEENAGR